MSDTSGTKEAIVFVPSFFGKEKNFSLNAYLIRGLIYGAVSAEIKDQGEISINGCKGKALDVNFYTGDRKTIHLYEAYWIDLLRPLSRENLKDKMLRGTALLFYWTFSGIWRTFKECPSMVLTLITSLVMVVFWYYGTAAMALTAMGQDPTFFGSTLPAAWSNRLSHFGQQMGGWSVWLTFSAFLTFIRVDTLIDIADSMRHYLEDSIDELTGEPLQIKLRNRLLETLESVIDTHQYETITLVAHGYGTVLATELLANASDRLGQPIRYISLGGPLKFLALRSPWIYDIIDRCLRNPFVSSWIDYYADRDWLCTAVPIRADNTSHKFESYKTLRKISLWDAVNGKSHLAYFYNQEIIEVLIGPTSLNSH